MIRRRTSAIVGAAALGGLCFLTGCSKSPSSDAAPSAQSAAAPSPETAAIERATSDFMDAVLKGDIQRASTRLTPEAMQRITASGLQFAPPGFGNETFKIAEVRSPQVDMACVSCVVTDVSDPAGPRQMEIAWSLRRIGNEWRVFGMGVPSTMNRPGFMQNFETGQFVPFARDPAMTGTGSPSSSPPTSTPALPPRMATEPAAPAQR
jgi:hypothetical protein